MSNEVTPMSDKLVVALNTPPYRVGIVEIIAHARRLERIAAQLAFCLNDAIRGWTPRAKEPMEAALTEYNKMKEELV